MAQAKKDALTHALLETVRLVLLQQGSDGEDEEGEDCDAVPSFPAWGVRRHFARQRRQSYSLSPEQDSEEDGSLSRDGEDTSGSPNHRSRRPASPKAGVLGGPCAHCGSTESPQWRRPLTKKVVLCNACGIYYSRHHSMPKWKKASRNAPRVPLEPVFADAMEDSGDAAEEVEELERRAPLRRGMPPPVSSLPQLPRPRLVAVARAAAVATRLLPAADWPGTGTLLVQRSSGEEAAPSSGLMPHSPGSASPTGPPRPAPGAEQRDGRGARKHKADSDAAAVEEDGDGGHRSGGSGGGGDGDGLRPMKRSNSLSATLPSPRLQAPLLSSSSMTLDGAQAAGLLGPARHMPHAGGGPPAPASDGAAAGAQPLPGLMMIRTQVARRRDSLAWMAGSSASAQTSPSHPAACPTSSSQSQPQPPPPPPSPQAPAAAPAVSAEPPVVRNGAVLIPVCASRGPRKKLYGPPPQPQAVPLHVTST